MDIWQRWADGSGKLNIAQQPSKVFVEIMLCSSHRSGLDQTIQSIAAVIWRCSGSQGWLFLLFCVNCPGKPTILDVVFCFGACDCAAGGIWGRLIPHDIVDRVASEGATGKRAARDPLKLHLAQSDPQCTRSS